MLFAWPGLVLCWWVAPSNVGRAVSVWVLVRGVLAGSLFGLFCWFAVVFAAGVVGCWVSVVFASTGRTGWPPERV